MTSLPLAATVVVTAAKASVARLPSDARRLPVLPAGSRGGRGRKKKPVGAEASTNGDAPAATATIMSLAKSTLGVAGAAIRDEAYFNFYP